MEETEKILLNGKRNKMSVNTNSTLNVDLRSNSRLLPEDALDEDTNAYEVYLSERNRSNRFRLIFNIRPYCTNVLFNPFTEIVKFEGSSSAFCLNFSASTTEQLENSDIMDKCSVLVKRNTLESEEESCLGINEPFTWNAYEGVRDTQLSNEACGFSYHNGLDIFNNHILRNKTFKSVMLSDDSFKKIGGTLENFPDGTPLYGSNYDIVRVYDSTFGNIEKRYLDKNFNTIDDYLRDKSGIIVSESLPRVVGEGDNIDFKSLVMPLHTYQKYDVRDFDESYEDKLIEDNGWYGYSNDSSMSGLFSAPSDDPEDKVIKSYTEDFSASPDFLDLCDDDGTINLTASSTEIYELRKKKKDMNINKVMNNEPYCAFIDMYPTRDLFSFNPLWNSYRKRLEKNWNYCLTYPSSSTTKEIGGSTFEFFKEINKDSSTTIALKALMYDEYQVMDDGTKALTIYSICQHGLQEGDTVNIYKDNEVVYDTATVLRVVDKYVFQIAKEDFNIADGWTLEKGIWNMRSPLKNGRPIIPTVGNTIRYTSDMSEVSFKRIVNNVECEYYVRIFSRLPNFKFADKEINDYNLYGNNANTIERYSDPTSDLCDFENHISSLGFASTTYSDNDAEIVYTDDINVDYLKDNLGRPLSDIFLTIVKNNKGYKEWYGRNHDLGEENVEYSHCFGKVNCGFLLSDFYRYINTGFSRDVRDINSYDGRGLTMGGSDEINFYEDRHYYGDIVCYSPLDCDEQVIQNCMHRFNTVQRELNGIGNLDITPFNGGTLTYDEVIRDEDSIPWEEAQRFFNGELPHSEKREMTDMCSQDEGYYYQAHYVIPIKTISQSVSSDAGIQYNIFCERGKNAVGRDYLVLTTIDENEVENGDVLTLYDKTNNKIYFLIVDNNGVKSSKSFRCFVRNEMNERVDDLSVFFDENGLFKVDELAIIGRTDDIPCYAKVVKDGSCRYYWREILANGTEDDEKTYPFTNGAFYITQQIDFYLRRQDPDNTMISVKWGEKSTPTALRNYPPIGENVSDYPSLDAEDFYEDKEIREC